MAAEGLSLHFLIVFLVFRKNTFRSSIIEVAAEPDAEGGLVRGVGIDSVGTYTISDNPDAGEVPRVATLDALTSTTAPAAAETAHTS